MREKIQILVIFLFVIQCSLSDSTNIEKNIESNQDVNQTSKEAASIDKNDNILEITKEILMNELLKDGRVTIEEINAVKSEIAQIIKARFSNELNDGVLTVEEVKAFMNQGGSTYGSPVPVPFDSVSAITSAPLDMNEINTYLYRFGTGGNPDFITLGPKDGLKPYPPYATKHSNDIDFEYHTPVLAPIDMKLVGFTNTRSNYRIRDNTEYGKIYITPFDDMHLCFESTSSDWPNMAICVYHIFTSPLLAGHTEGSQCWKIKDAYYDDIKNKILLGHNYWHNGDAYQLLTGKPEDCRVQIGRLVKRGDVIGYAGSLGQLPVKENSEGNFVTKGIRSLASFKFKVSADFENPTVEIGNRFLHWVQPDAFFYWQCYKPDTNFEKGVLAYPFECGSYKVPEEESDWRFKYTDN